MTSLEIKVDYLARVEGEGGIDVRVVDGRVEDIKVNIFEPPRFFQGFLVGRKFDDVPDITARICGICPVSHMMASIQAIEDALGVVPSPQVRDLRSLLTLSQFIQSHTLHIYMLQLPDYLGYESVIAMAGDYGPVVKRALRMKRVANDFTALIGGREIHPVTAVVGGFTRIPTREELLRIKSSLLSIKEDALETVKLVSTLQLPDFNPDTEHVALYDPEEYPVNGRRLRSTKGLDIDIEEYRTHIKERQVEHSNTLHSYIEGRGSFLVGPLARINLNHERLSPDAQEALHMTGLRLPCFNPFAGVLARAVEIVHAIDESVRIIDRLEPQPEPAASVVPKVGTGYGVSEAPRGVLYHSYRFDSEGMVSKADIVPPTAHNLSNMERDLWAFVPSVLSLTQEEATLRCEMVIRNYDPCISCSCH